MIIVMCCTKNWYQYLLVDLYALLNTNQVQKIYLFIEDDELPELNYFKKYNTKFVIYNYHNILNKYIEDDNKNKSSFSAAALIRLFIANYIKEDKFLYLDTDVIVLANISELWNTKIDNYYLAGVKDLTINKHLDYLDVLQLDEDTYINSGVLLMNLKKFREDNLICKIKKLINDKVYRFPDQDILNIVCKNKILLISSAYNASMSTDFIANFKIIHYAHKKFDWIKGRDYSEYWYKWEERYNSFLENYKLDNKNKEIDLVILVYNSLKYIDRALKSVVKQTIKDKIVVTIIDDGSTEDYTEVLKKYENELDIKYYKYRKNRGVGYAREYSLSKTKLPYLFFLDSDDTLYDKFVIEKLYTIINNNPKCSVAFGKELINKDILFSYHHAHGKLYLRKRIDDLKLHFIKNRGLEDVVFNYSFFTLIKESEVEVIEDIIINYNKSNNDSVTKNVDMNQKSISALKTIIKTKTPIINVKYPLLLLMNYCDNDSNNKFKNSKIMVEYYKVIYKFYKKIYPYIKYELFKDSIKYIELKKFIHKISQY